MPRRKASRYAALRVRARFSFLETAAQQTQRATSERRYVEPAKSEQEGRADFSARAVTRA
jgi:hypothetical protein